MQTPANNIPKPVLDMLRSGDVMELTEQIAQSHGLEPQYYGALYRATVAVLKGELPPSGYVNQIIDEMELSREEAIVIAQEVNRDIFNKVKDSLMATQTTVQPTTPSTAIPTPYQGVAGGIAPVVAPLKTEVVVAPQTLPLAPTREATTTTVAEKPLRSPQEILMGQKPNISVPQASQPPIVPAPPIPQAPTLVTAPLLVASPVAPPIPRMVIPAQVVTPTPPAPTPNNLESKLGGAFTIKKEVMFTQPGNPTPLTPAGATQAGTVPVLPPPPSGDPYRELP